MKRFLLLFSALISISALAQSQRQNIDTIYVSKLYTTTLVFDTEIEYVNISNMQILSADITKTLKNILVMKAKEAFKTTASLTAIESNGIIHTKIIAYREHPDRLTIDLKRKTRSAATTKLNEAPAPAPSPAAAAAAGTTAAAASAATAASASSGKAVKQKEPKQEKTKQKKTKKEDETVSIAEQMEDPDVITAVSSEASATRKTDAPKISAVIDLPRGYYHLVSRSQRITAACENIFAYSDITYLVVSVENNSGVSFIASEASFTIESHNGGKRKIDNKINISPKNRYGNISCAPGETGKMAFSFDKITLADDQVFNITIYEQDGQRNMTITLSPKDVNFAKKPFK